jgi:hypothetical protein
MRRPEGAKARGESDGVRCAAEQSNSNPSPAVKYLTLSEPDRVSEYRAAGALRPWKGYSFEERELRRLDTFASATL